MLSWKITVISISGYFTQRMIRFVQWLYCNLLIQHTKPVAFSTRCTYIRFWILHVTQWVVVYTPCTWDSLYIYVYLCIFLASLMYLYSNLLVPLILWFSVLVWEYWRGWLSGLWGCDLWNGNVIHKAPVLFAIFIQVTSDMSLMCE